MTSHRRSKPQGDFSLWKEIRRYESQGFPARVPYSAPINEFLDSVGISVLLLHPFFIDLFILPTFSNAHSVVAFCFSPGLLITFVHFSQGPLEQAFHYSIRDTHYTHNGP